MGFGRKFTNKISTVKVTVQKIIKHMILAECQKVSESAKGRLECRRLRPVIIWSEKGSEQIPVKDKFLKSAALRRAFRESKRRCYNRLCSESGQTFILVMTVTALASVLGMIAMSSALMSVRLRSINRVSDKNFYRLELAEKEVQLGLARCAMEYDGQENWRENLLKTRAGIHDLTIFLPENEVRMGSRREKDLREAANFLEGFSVTVPTKEEQEGISERLSIEVGGLEVDGDGIIFKDVAFTLRNYERDAQSTICCDIILRIDGGSTLEEVAEIANWERIG